MASECKGTIGVVIADDHALIRQGLKALLGLEKNIKVLAEVISGDEVLPCLHAYQPDVILMDINMPKMNGIECLKAIRGENLSVKVLLLTVETDRKVLLEAIEIGASGYLLKGSDASEIIAAINSVCAGENYIDRSLVSVLFGKVSSSKLDVNPFIEMTPREMDILYLIALGHSNKEISEILYLSEKTVKNNITRMFRKLDVKDRVHATIFARDNGIFDHYKNERT